MAVLYPFSSKTVELLENAPKAGETHRWLAQVAGALKAVKSAESCFKFLRRCCDELVHHRQVPDSEIRQAIEFAYGSKSLCVLNKAYRSHKWPKPDCDFIKQTLSTTEPLFDASKSTGHISEFVLSKLFRPTDLVCTGRTTALTTVRLQDDAIRDAHWLQFIVPNPMLGLFHFNKEGKKSKRCQNNVKLRRYLVTEIDSTDLSKHDQARIITKLSTLAPLVMVVDSGGKSLHAWFFAEDMSDQDQIRFFSVACMLEADPKTWDVCGWVRMPGGNRYDEGKPPVMQRILFFNPGVLYERADTATNSIG